MLVLKKQYIFIAILALCSLGVFANEPSKAVADRQQTLDVVNPSAVGLDASRLAYADSAVYKAIASGNIPGAVLCVVRHGKIGYLKAYGNRSLYPAKEPMTVETIFDLASVTKPLATATCAMKLIEDGRLRLQDAVRSYIPGFENWHDSLNHSKTIRIVNLLTHTSGLLCYDGRPVSALQQKYGAPNPEGLIDFISHSPRCFAPGEGYKYSCLNYITLQYIIEKITGKSLQQLANEYVFAPLGMTHTFFNPPVAVRHLCAPTEKLPDGTWLRGVARDSLARIMMGGVSGNAGLFSTAQDIAVYCAAVLNGGEWNGHRILSSIALKCMENVPEGLGRWSRTPGWEAFSSHSSTPGDLLSRHSFGHSGDTGTSVVIDPDNDIAIILLTNCAHPTGQGNTVRLRGYVANAVASAIE